MWLFLLIAADAFERKVEIAGLVLTSAGRVSEGTRHCAETVKVGSKTLSGECLPIFTQAFLLGEGRALALGWSSGGSGMESIDAWVLQVAPAQVLDTFALNKPRDFPDLAFDEKAGMLGVFIPRGAACTAAVVRMRMKVDLCDYPALQAQWRPYDAHPYATAKMPGMLRAVIQVQDGRFSVHAGPAPPNREK